ncbi:winged helix-turn-helix transcriptional regulator [Pedobacter sp. PAMC26386]|nr:winged helix-turn-helix transcriptional regulator [Pedobacter sp. PAMC26386]
MGKIKENSTNNMNRKHIINDCDLTYSVCMIGGRWKLLILCRLETGKLRFSELRREICNITERMLTLQLRELENDGIIKRTVYAEVPPRVEYELTEIGKELIPIWGQLSKWGTKHRALIK